MLHYSYYIESLHTRHCEAVITYDNYYDEYRVRVSSDRFADFESHELTEYFTDDLTDAQDTARMMIDFAEDCTSTESPMTESDYRALNPADYPR